MLGWFWRRFATPRVSDRLLRHLDETLVQEVHHHWICFVWPGFLALVGLVVALGGLSVPTNIAWAFFLVGAGLVVWAAIKALVEHMDRFVITNMRAFRVRGVLAQSAATMPLSRVLDITVHQTVPGRLLGYGHFVFESAAQEQGLREIRFVPHPGEVDLMIQEQVQQAGLRGGKPVRQRRPFEDEPPARVAPRASRDPYDWAQEWPDGSEDTWPRGVPRSSGPWGHAPEDTGRGWRER